MIRTIEHQLPPKNALNIFLIVLLAISIVYNSGSALMTVNVTIGLELLFTSYIILLVKYSKFSLRIKFNLFNLSFFLLMVMVINSFLFNFDLTYIASNIRYVLIISFAFIFVKSIEFELFVKYYIKTMKFIVVISLIPYYIINYLNINFLQSLPIIENVNGVQYYNGILFYYFTYSHLRNIGVFWEPSIFSSLIVMAMVYEICFKKEKTSYINIMIFTVGIITSQSTGGIFLIPLVLFLYLFKNANTLKSLILQIGLLLTSLFAFFNSNQLILLLAEIFPRAYLQLDTAQDNVSVVDRLQSPLANFELFLGKPFFGLGLGNVDTAYSFLNITQTSTSTYYLATFGTLGIIYTFLIVYGVMKQKYRSLNERFIITIIILIIVNKEPHFWFVGTYIILFYFIKPELNVEIK
ncbi:hypothetical protein [Paenibacillus qinlingensis]|uniref:hypothetical protein n=2 Tax=Paenibacillus qinlingensis TaxID=1837343 RepID=UPI0015679B52|nr:hypothetical protein [Paenibacillus qinlingensis]NQX59453.1 hypothetical protein [Paenibacillus qinlingensis]